MFSFFSQKMDSDQGGELGDIIRGSNGYDGPPAMMSTTDWKFLPLPESISFPSSTQVSSDGYFGDPFSYSGRDPLLDELPAPNCSDSSNGGFVKLGIKVGMNGQVGDGSGTSSSTSALVATDQKMQGFLQFSLTSRSSPVLTRGLIRPPPIVVDGHVMKMMNSNNISSFLSDHNNLQISSPPRTPGIKRRKSQARKVVCIPAPAAAGSRASGEVVPSDLWAWRKYGQKPIKGSPYPRGYYRCSSSKGCSARKQVERSRTDPNMLVITYTSEHNHPWPTQRNALAGSTRAQPAKTSTSASKSSRHDQKDDQQTKEIAIDCIRAAKEEEAVEMEIKAPILDDDLDQDVVFSSNYKPMFDELCNSDDLFNIGEFDPDPMDLVYISKGLLDEKPEEQEERQNGSKGVDPFSLFDWEENTIGESKNVGLE